MEPYKRHWRSDNRQARRSGAADCGCGRGVHGAPSHYSGTRVWVYAALFFLLFTVAAPLGLTWAQEAPAGSATEYRDILPGILGSRNLIWIIAQQHHMLAGFVLGVPIFAWVCEIVGVRTRDPRYDTLAKEFTKLLTSAYATTALFGGILLFLLLGLYPKLMVYLTDVFFPSFIVYSVLFLLETATLYLYWYGWDSMQGAKKGLHLFLGFLLNVFAFFIMIVPNSWATFQASPVVITERSMWAKAILTGILFLGANYYFWLGIMYRIPGSEAKYRKPIMTMLVILLVCLGVWMTPHSLVASLEEARKMGGTHHPLLGVFGVMSAKMTVVNIMILVTFMSFIIYWRAGKQVTATWAKVAQKVMGGVLGLAAIVVIVLGVWGYFVPAIVRINYFSVAQVLIVLFVLVTITPLTGLLMKSARTTTEMIWGRMPPRAGYALVLNAVMVILLMTLMGYARSSSRVHWHIYGVMRDSSQYAYSPALGYAAAFMSLNTFVFCLLVAFIFWVATMGDKAKAGEPGTKKKLPAGAYPAMAGGSPTLDDQKQQ